MSIAGITAGKAFIELGINDSGLVQGIGRVKGILDKFDHGTRDLINLSNAFKQAGNGAGMLNSALGFIVANPITTAIVAITAGLKIYNSIAESSAKAQERLNDQLKVTAEFRNADLNRAEKERQNDIAKLKRLTEIAKMENKTSEDVAEASRLKKELNQRYGTNIQYTTLGEISQAWETVRRKQYEERQKTLAEEEKNLTDYADVLAKKISDGSVSATKWGLTGNAVDLMAGIDHQGDVVAQLKQRIITATGDERLEKFVPQLRELLKTYEDLADVKKRLNDGDRGRNEAQAQREIERQKAETEAKKAEIEASKKAIETANADAKRKADEERLNAEKKITEEKAEQAKIDQQVAKIRGMNEKDALEKQISLAKANAENGNRSALNSMLSRYKGEMASDKAFLDGVASGKIKDASSADIESVMQKYEFGKSMVQRLTSIDESTKALKGEIVDKNGNSFGGFNARAVGAMNGAYSANSRNNGVFGYTVGRSVQQVSNVLQQLFLYHP